MKEALPRIDKMTEAPIVGRYYLVPTVRAEWYGQTLDWPVVGPEHDDQQFFNFPYRHYHLDARFLTHRQKARVIYSNTWDGDDNDRQRLARACVGSPLQTNGLINKSGLPKPELKRKRCSLSVLPLSNEIAAAKTWLAMAAHYAGRTCANGKRGWVCPHQNVALSSVLPVNGVITCPLHGLQIDAQTGVVLVPSP
jgi:hypothetical protein